MSTTLSETIEMTITTTENPKVGPELARSWLLVNGAQPARFDVAANSAADVVVLDVEDSVAPADKAAARQNVIEWLSSRNERHELNHGWVRINGFGTAWWEEDLRALREAPHSSCKGPAPCLRALPQRPVEPGPRCLRSLEEWRQRS